MAVQQGVTTEGTSYVYTGNFGLIARPVLTIKLNTYTFNKNDGSLTDEVIEQWIKSRSAVDKSGFDGCDYFFGSVHTSYTGLYCFLPEFIKGKRCEI